MGDCGNSTDTYAYDAWGNVVDHTGATHTFYWDGKDAGNEEVEPGTYTYDVHVSQVDINDADYDPPKETSDWARFRSDYMEILRASDDQNNPIFEAEYHGYDDGGTPEDEEDDNYIYLVRYYKLRDFLFPDVSKDASEGEIWLYDPDLEKVGEWDIAGLLYLSLTSG